MVLVDSPNILVAITRFHLITFHWFLLAVNSSFRGLVIKDPVSVHRKWPPASHVLEVHLDGITSFSFQHGSQETKVLWVGFFLGEVAISKLSIKNFLVLGSDSVHTTLCENRRLAAKQFCDLFSFVLRHCACLVFVLSLVLRCSVCAPC